MQPAKITKPLRQQVFYFNKTDDIWLEGTTFYTKYNGANVELNGFTRSTDQDKGNGISNYLIEKYMFYKNHEENPDSGAPIPTGDCFPNRDDISNMGIEGTFLDLFEEYDPKNGQTLYYEFVAIKPTNQDGMLHFLKKYGALDERVQTVGIIAEEITKMDLILKARSLLQKADNEVNLSYYRDVAAGIYRFFRIQFGGTASKKLNLDVKTKATELMNMPLEKLKIETKIWIDELIRNQLKKIRPDWRDVPDQGTSLFWDIPDLLAAMYYMMAVDIMCNISVEVCKRPGCNNYFNLTKAEPTKVFCCPACSAGYYNKKNYENRKQKAAIQGTLSQE